jgi:phosphatidylethanolamine-binding protein (PEBP) family uncharacterized protein
MPQKLRPIPTLLLGLSIACCSAENPHQIAVKVVISPANSAVVLGETVRFAAQAFDENGRVISDVTAAILPTDSTVLSLDGVTPGLVKAVGVGRAALVVTAGAASAMATVTVSCPQSKGPTSHYGTIDRSEVWRAVDSPHQITGDLVISGTESDNSPVTVVIESCAKVEVAKDAAIFVGNGGLGVLSVQGANTKEGPSGLVTFVPDDPTAGPGYWAGIVFNSQGKTASSLLRSASIVKAGGKALKPPQAAIKILGEEGTASPPNLSGIIVEQSGGHGIALSQEAGVGLDSKNLTITKAALSAVSTPAQQAGTVPDGTFTDNGANEILVTGGALTIPATWAVNTVPYHIIGDVAIGSGRMGPPGRGAVVPFLALGSGVTMRFAKGVRLSVAHQVGEVGGILWIGTASAPITLTSAEANPAPGDWVGVVAGRGLDVRSTMVHTTISYAGAPSGIAGADGDYQHADNGSLILLVAPSVTLVQNSTFQQSAGYGIVRGFIEATAISFVGHSASAPANPSIRPELANTFDEKTLVFGKESASNPLVLASQSCVGTTCQTVLKDGDPIKQEMLCGSTAKSPPLSWRYNLTAEKAKPYTDQVKSYALLVRQEVPNRSLHWLISDLPTSTASLAAGTSPGSLPAGAKETNPYNVTCPAAPSECTKIREECSTQDTTCLAYFNCTTNCANLKNQCHSTSCDRIKLNGICALPIYSFELRALSVPTIDLAGATTLDDLEAKLQLVTLGVASFRVTYKQ